MRPLASYIVKERVCGPSAGVRGGDFSWDVGAGWVVCGLTLSLAPPSSVWERSEPRTERASPKTAQNTPHQNQKNVCAPLFCRSRALASVYRELCMPCRLIASCAPRPCAYRAWPIESPSPPPRPIHVYTPRGLRPSSQSGNRLNDGRPRNKLYTHGAIRGNLIPILQIMPRRASPACSSQLQGCPC